MIDIKNSTTQDSCISCGSPSTIYIDIHRKTNNSFVIDLCSDCEYELSQKLSLVNDEVEGDAENCPDLYPDDEIDEEEASINEENNSRFNHDEAEPSLENWQTYKL